MVGQLIRFLAFDLSNTLVKAKPYPPVAMIAGLVGKEEKAARYMERFHKGEITYSKLISIVSRLWKGVEVRDLEKVVKRLEFFENVENTIRGLKQKHIKMAIISTAPRQLLELINDKLNIDYVCGTICEIENGLFTGKVIKAYVNKGIAVKEIMEREGFSKEECMAVGDSRNDIDMFKVVGHSVLFRPKVIEKEAADYVIEDFKELLKIVDRINSTD